MRVRTQLGLGSLLLLLVSLVPSWAQNVNAYYSDIAWTVTYIAGQTTFTPISNATLQVCAYPANAVPCTNLATLYLGPTIAGGTGPNPISTDAFGNFAFWAPAGYYQYTLTNSLNQSVGPYTVVLGAGSGGGGGGATFPSTPGIVYNTSTVASTTATSAQIVAGLNSSPLSGATLVSALLPVATTGALGTVRPDGTTITISGGVISAPSTGGIIPNTTLVLKGGGAVGLSVAAIPSVDYVIPSGNVATATALAANPSVCGSGQAAVGILASGAPSSCINVTTSTAQIVASEESVSFSATPTFSTAVRESTITLSANVSTFTLSAGSPGQEKTLTFCQNGTGGFTVTPPANVHGFMTTGITASKCSSQHFTYNGIQTVWLADSPGVLNE
jgi:hypothetical protein